MSLLRGSIWLLLILLVACSSPAARDSSLADESGETSGVVPDNDFDLTAADMPPSFRLDGGLPDEARAAIEAHPAVRDVVDLESSLQQVQLTLRRAADPRLRLSIVYLHPDAGERGKQAVREIIGTELPGVFFVDQETTYDEFKAFYEGDPDAVDVPLEAMPPSWRADLNLEPLPYDLQAELEASEFVRTVTNPAMSS